MDLPTPTFGPPPQIPSADASVRAASAQDAAGIGEVQALAWRAAYSQVLPAETVDALDPARLAQIWRAAISSPPTRAHRVLVALSAGEVVGFAATGPSEGDRGEVGELLALVVAPAGQRAGHGSRLLNAAADQLRQSGFDQVVVWVLTGDEARLSFLTAAGFAADGAQRSLQVAAGNTPELREHRLVASLAPPQ